MLRGRGQDDVAVHNVENIRQHQHAAALVLRASSVIIDAISASSRHGAICVAMANEGAASSIARIIESGIRSGGRIIEHSHARDGRRDLRQHLQPFAGHQRIEIAEAGDIAFRMRQIFDEALIDRIGHHRKHDGDRAGLAAATPRQPGWTGQAVHRGARPVSSVA